MSKEKEISGELIVREEPIGVVADDTIVAIAEKVEARMKALNTIVKFCIKRTNPKDWIDQNGRPYLQASGAEKLRWPLGISWRFDEPVKENEEGGHYSYSVKGYFAMYGLTIEAIGARSTKDPFFNKYDYSTGNKIQLPPSEIDHNDVKKAAITNCIGNGITRLLGIRNMSWEELEEAGLDLSKITRIEYKQAEESKETKDLREEIRRMILEMAKGDQVQAKKSLEEFTSFIPKGKTEADRVKGKSHIKDLTEKQIAPTYGKVKETYEKWQKEQKETTRPIEAIVEDFKIALQNASTIEELDGYIDQIIKAGIKGEHYTTLIRERDKRATVLKGKLI